MKKENPTPPLSRIQNFTIGVGFCDNCGSSLYKRGFAWMPCEKFCLNDECKNSKSKVK